MSAVKYLAWKLVIHHRFFSGRNENRILAHLRETFVSLKLRLDKSVVVSLDKE